jgi:hypothetical protein
MSAVKLWAVGDDDQTLYAFRASDVRHILDFDAKYEGARIHTLTRCHADRRSNGLPYYNRPRPLSILAASRSSDVSITLESPPK